MIRHLVLDDLEDILVLDAMALKSNWYLSDYKSEILSEDSLCLGLVLDDKLYGFIIFRRSFLDAELMQIMVHPDKQGNSLGAELMIEAEQLLFNQSVTDLHLEVSDNNMKAIALYKKLGFIEIRKRKNYYGHGLDALLMRKRLVR